MIIGLIVLASGFGIFSGNVLAPYGRRQRLARWVLTAVKYAAATS
jgi:hypothetical protein